MYYTEREYFKPLPERLSQMLRKIGKINAMTRTRRTSLQDSADRLRVLREALGLTQVQISRVCGIGQQAWNNYEGARRRISVDQALRLRNSIGVTLDWIYAGDPKGLPWELWMKIRTTENLQRHKKELA